MKILGRLSDLVFDVLKSVRMPNKAASINYSHIHFDDPVEPSHAKLFEKCEN
jgi:hypothetical protein